MTLYKGTTAIAGIPTGLIATVNSKADANNVYTKTEIDTKPQVTAVYLKTTYVSGASGYNIWSNGYCEQWGTTGNYASGSFNVSFLKTFANTNYALTHSLYGNDGNTYNNALRITKSATNYFNIYTVVDKQMKVSWMTCGYLASGQY